MSRGARKAHLTLVGGHLEAAPVGPGRAVLVVGVRGRVRAVPASVWSLGKASG